MAVELKSSSLNMAQEILPEDITRYRSVYEQAARLENGLQIGDDYDMDVASVAPLPTLTELAGNRRIPDLASFLQKDLREVYDQLVKEGKVEQFTEEELKVMADNGIKEAGIGKDIGNYALFIRSVFFREILWAAEGARVFRRAFRYIRQTEGNNIRYMKGTKDVPIIPQISERGKPPELYPDFTEEQIFYKMFGGTFEISRIMAEDQNTLTVDMLLQRIGLEFAKREDTELQNILRDQSSSYSGSSPINLDHLSDMIYAAEQNDYAVTVIIMNPLQANQLRKLDDFKDSAGKFQAIGDYVDQTLMRNFVGRAYGVPILRSTRCDKGTVYAVDVPNAAWFVERRPLDVQSYVNTAEQIVAGRVITQRYGGKVIWPNAAIKGTGFGTT